MKNNEAEQDDSKGVKSFVIVYSYHHHNTEKIANAIGRVLDAPVKTPEQVSAEDLSGYRLIGFGSGIYSGQNHESVLELVDALPPVKGTSACIFSTYGAPDRLFQGERQKKFIAQNHAKLREKLQLKGYRVIDEFACPGFNTNSFLTLFGGLNKGRPNDEDIRNAEAFAEKVKQLAGTG
ncbi:MAG: flavodoxin family protein [Methanospirillaceae archaeon]|nr:flavodoxin family protein [Methanospirillaceae archaeon]